MKVYFKTFGCRSNIFDTQLMISQLESHTLSNEEDADIIVINSCTVTNNADKSLKEYISKIKKQNKKIVFTGCALQSVGRQFYDKSVIFGAFGHSKKAQIDTLLNAKEAFFYENDLKAIDSTPLKKLNGKTRAFIKVQEGCNFKCSYCIIPQVRGKARSLNRNLILHQIATLADSGVSEVILSGTNLGSYGKDTNDTLPKLILDIAKISGIKRIRLGSLEPSQIKDDFLDILDLPVMERHLHIAIQHTHNQMLKVMNRINRFEKDLALFELIAKKGFALGSDFIVAHPEESEEIFEIAFTHLRNMPLTHIHCFIYSPRNGTKSALMPNTIPKQLAKERLFRVKSLVDSNNLNFRNRLKEQNNALNILVESKKGEFFYGFDEFFNKIAIKSNQNLAGKWLKLSSFNTKKDINYAEV